MTYSTKVTQPQFVGKFKIDPNGGTITDQQLKEFKKDPYGADLIAKGIFSAPAESKTAAKPNGRK